MLTDSQTADGVEEYLKSLRVDAVDYGETKLAEGLGSLLGRYLDTLVTADTSVKKCNFIVILGGRDGESFGLFSYKYLTVSCRARPCGCREGTGFCCTTIG